MKNEILVTGASGFVGRALCTELCQLGCAVVAAVRSINGNEYPQEVIGFIDGDTNWLVALKDKSVVIHLAARVHVMNDTAVDPLLEFRKVNVDGTLQLASQAAKAGVSRFIFISSIKVNGEYTEVGKPFVESNTTNPKDAYSVSKFEAEQGLLLIAQQTGMEVVIIRPTLVYGAGVKANFASMMWVVQKGFPLPLGAIQNKRSFVYIDNLVSLIIKCIDHPAAANQVFLVSDGEDLSTTELLRKCAEAVGVQAKLFPLSQKFIEFCAEVLGKQDFSQRLCGNLQVDITKARTLLGWIPPISVADGLKITAQEFKKVN